jgi:hypothetical protein
LTPIRPCRLATANVPGMRPASVSTRSPIKHAPGAENTVPEDVPQRRPATDVRPAQPRSAGGLLHTVTERLFQTRWATARGALAPDVARAPEVAAACDLEGSEVAAGLES